MTAVPVSGITVIGPSGGYGFGSGEARNHPSATSWRISKKKKDLVLFDADHREVARYKQGRWHEVWSVITGEPKLILDEPCIVAPGGTMIPTPFGGGGGVS